MLRCRKGDMAMVIKSYSGREGFVVTVGEFRGSVRGLIDVWAIESSVPPPQSRGVP